MRRVSRLNPYLVQSGADCLAQCQRIIKKVTTDRVDLGRPKLQPIASRDDTPGIGTSEPALHGAQYGEGPVSGLRVDPRLSCDRRILFVRPRRGASTEG